MSAPLPPDITALLADLQVALPDPAHDLLRGKVLSTAQVVWNYHVDLLNELQTTQDEADATKAALATTQADLTALTARVAALENPLAPAPAPTTTP